MKALRNLYFGMSLLALVFMDIVEMKSEEYRHCKSILMMVGSITYRIFCYLCCS